LFSFCVSSIGNQTFFSSSSILTLLLTPADHNHILRCQVSNEASIDKTNVDIKLEILCRGYREKKSILIIFSFCLIVKPIIKIIFHDKELNTNSLTIIENTFDIIRCRIASNPSIGLDIQWFKNEQLILGKIID
jgi:hypothetical protein